MKKIKNKEKGNKYSRSGQATLEFAFTFIIVVLMLYGCVKVLQWLGLSLGTPTEKHSHGLLYVYPQCIGNNPYCNPLSQLYAADQESSQGLPRLNAVFTGQLINP